MSFTQKKYRLWRVGPQSSAAPGVIGPVFTAARSSLSIRVRRFPAHVGGARHAWAVDKVWWSVALAASALTTKGGSEHDAIPAL